MSRASVSGLSAFYRRLTDKIKPWIEEGLVAFSTFNHRERVRFSLFLIIFCLSILGLILVGNNRLLVTVAAPGGTLNEGIVGYPRLINPLLAISDADKDLVALIYSGLLRINPDGQLIPDLAQALPEVSPDGLTYTVKLRPDLVWHDGEPITSEDVVFTIGRAVDPLIKSPRRATWEGISVQALDKETIQFTLKQPYSGFSENLTLGILPKHLWDNLTADNFGLSNLNIEPVGSGPYKIDSITRDSDGIPQTYALVPFNKFSLSEPKLQNINLRFHANEEELIQAMADGKIKAAGGVSPKSISGLNLTEQKVASSSLPRVFAVFFNQNQNKVLADKAVRQALDEATDRQQIIDRIFAGYAIALDGPLPSNTSVESGSIEKAKETLEKAGWKVGPNNIRTKSVSRSETLTLSFSLATVNNDELKDVGEDLIKTWRTLGADVRLEPYDTSDLQQNIIRPRKYDALLFGTALNQDPDLFPFWHSSQRLDPGLNISMYTSKNTDNYLEEARNATDQQDKEAARQKAVEEIRTDRPAIFLYSPVFIYILPEKINSTLSQVLTNPAERFASIHRWYINTDKIWPVFANRTYTIIKR